MPVGPVQAEQPLQTVQAPHMSVLPTQVGRGVHGVGALQTVQAPHMSVLPTQVGRGVHGVGALQTVQAPQTSVLGAQVGRSVHSHPTVWAFVQAQCGVCVQ
jgi:hypothetical protein